MGINAAKAAGGVGKERVEQPVLEAGVYPARLVQVIDMGLQAQRPYQGQDKPPVQEIMLTYELVDTFMVGEDGEEIEDKPRWVTEIIPLHNLKAEKAKSTKRYLALDPNCDFEGDFSKVVGVPVNVTLVQNQVQEKTYVNVAGIASMRPKDAIKTPALINDSKIFDLDNPDLEIFSTLPEWIQEKIKKNLNYKGSKLDRILSGEPPDIKEEAPPEEEGPPW